MEPESELRPRWSKPESPVHHIAAWIAAPRCGSSSCRDDTLHYDGSSCPKSFHDRKYPYDVCTYRGSSSFDSSPLCASFFWPFPPCHSGSCRTSSPSSSIGKCPLVFVQLTNSKGLFHLTKEDRLFSFILNSYQSQEPTGDMALLRLTPEDLTRALENIAHDPNFPTLVRLSLYRGIFLPSWITMMRLTTWDGLGHGIFS